MDVWLWVRCGAGGGIEDDRGKGHLHSLLNRSQGVGPRRVIHLSLLALFSIQTTPPIGGIDVDDSRRRLDHFEKCKVYEGTGVVVCVAQFF